MCNSNNFRQLNVTENSSNLIQITSAHIGALSYPKYHASKRDADTNYLTRVQIALRNYISDINFANPVNIRKVYEELMNQVRNEAICISNKYTIQIEPLNFERDKFIFTL